MSRGACSPVLALVVALTIAGCGGGDDPDPRAFAVHADRACRTLTTAVGKLRSGLVRTNADSEGAGLSTALERYADGVGRAADQLAAGRPPKNEAAFREDAVKGLRTHARAVRSAAGDARRGRAGSALDDELRGGELPMVPASLLADAPACRRTAD